MNAPGKNFERVSVYYRCRGLTLVEIMVAVLVMSIGVLGLAGLQTLSMRFNTSAHHRTQATALAYDLADRMRANRPAALNNDYNVAFQAPAPACAVAATVGTVRDQDIANWRSALACRIPRSTGSVTRVGDEFTITVRWDDTQGRELPTDFTFTTVL